MLSDVDGLYSADPTRDANAQHIPEVAAITPAIEALAGESVSGVGRGGMASKLIAAKIATAAGCEVIIAKGKIDHPLAAIRDGARRTRFHASTTPAAARKRWIAGVLKPQGTLMIDAGAAKALNEGKSLLPAGVKAVDGAFERGDAVLVRDADGREIARGLAAYSHEDARAHRRAAHNRNRGHSGLSWARRDDPSRRSGDDRWCEDGRRPMNVRENNLDADMNALGEAARAARRRLREASPEDKNQSVARSGVGYSRACERYSRCQREGHGGGFRPYVRAERSPRAR